MSHIHKPGKLQALPGAAGGFMLPFKPLAAKTTCKSGASTISKQMTNWTDLYLGFSSTCYVFMHNFLSVLDYAGIRLWILMVGIYNLMLCFFCWLIQGHFILKNLGYWSSQTHFFGHSFKLGIFSYQFRLKARSQFHHCFLSERITTLDVEVVKLKFLKKIYFESCSQARAPCQLMELY